ncbi:MAG: DUF5658 family protein [bacterium]|nr:DUF5658 family protein [bacterium]
MQSAGNPQASEEDANRPAWDGVDRRAGDRRDEPTRLFGGWLTPRRRAGGRRDSDRAGYVDRYTRRDVVLLLSVFLLNVFDAWMTMQWLSRGGREANPVMDFFLDISPTAFLVQKCLVVGFWLLILVAHKNFRFARIGLYASLVVYALLMLMHFGIVLLGIEPPTEAAIEAEAATTTRYGMEVDAPSAIMETAGRPAAE